jgi:hypothetical protein
MAPVRFAAAKHPSGTTRHSPRRVRRTAPAGPRETVCLRLTREESEALVCLCVGSVADGGQTEASLFRKLGQMLRESGPEPWPAWRTEAFTGAR